LAEELPVSKGKNRRSDRYPVVIPIKVKWLEPSGASVIEFAEAKEVNHHSGLLGMRGRPGIGSVIELTDLTSTKNSLCLPASWRFATSLRCRGAFS
jgi:hypothetical protein